MSVCGKCNLRTTADSSWGISQIKNNIIYLDNIIKTHTDSNNLSIVDSNSYISNTNTIISKFNKLTTKCINN